MNQTEYFEVSYIRGIKSKPTYKQNLARSSTFNLNNPGMICFTFHELHNLDNLKTPFLCKCYKGMV